MPASTKPSVADQLLDYLALEHAKTIFGVPGAGVMHLLKRIHDRDEFTYIITRHETGAAYMADGYYRATGKPGVVLVTSGPGATNALTGTMNAQFDGSAVLTLTGEVPEQFLGRGYLQEGTDCGLNVRDIYAAATRYSADIADASSMPILVEQALRSMLSIPRRAVHLSIADNIAAADARTDLYVSPRPPKSPEAYRCLPEGAPQHGVRRALEVLSSAKRPLILLGNGCWEALRDPATARALRCLVEWWNIPVITTSDGKGAFPETHRLSLRAYGFAGCLWPQYWMIDPATNGAAHDALLVIGSSLGELATYKWNPMLVPKGPFLQVDLDQSVIGRGFPVTDGIVAEAGAFIRALWDQAPAFPHDSAAVAARGKEIAEIRKNHSPVVSPPDAAQTPGTLHPAALCQLLNDHLLQNEELPGAMVFIDSGNCVGWSMHYMVVPEGREMHSALAMGPMGFAVCAVVGARYGRPDRLCVALVGDGALLMHLGEISTAAENKIGAIWVVLNDNDLNMVSQGMNAFLPDPVPFSYPLGNPDLRKVAEGLGAEAYDVEKPADFAPAWEAALRGAAAGRPQVIVAKVDPKAAPPYWSKPYWPTTATAD
ncbi:thiamine pyrophosphate-binding protein [Bradyrhizobium sp. Leo170]|uniref:thiamine pyrophosphate-binding protein n=1 Tax=Bradyrhizobium sp. Leo170 TaxID=1571199 RepID=UPI00102EB29E|nr:thiamine pyrophosphate-binding protein [Bradyrhizobium sp. Leo170]TAI65542.1 acetolactate synthase [Bradyrhizobium sp. Leo170]